MSAEYYYRMRVRPIYKSYPVYALEKEPPGYMEWLAKQEPEIVFDPAQLHTEADWIRAGELVFDAPTIFAPFDESPARDPEFYERSGGRLAANGTLPNKSYVIREKGKVEVGNLSCGQCHTRVMADGTVVKGAQGNFVEGFFFTARPRRALQNGGRSPAEILAVQRRIAASVRRAVDSAAPRGRSKHVPRGDSVGLRITRVCPKSGGSHRETSRLSGRI